jgi:O-antigen/teichoic acid export membrane protein
VTGTAGDKPVVSAAVPEREQYADHVGKIARGAGVSSVGQGVGRVLAFVTQVILARMFGAAQLGFYVLGISLLQGVNVLSTFGMDSVVVRYVALYRAEGDAARVRGTILLVLGVTFGLSFALSAVMFAGAGFLADVVFEKPFFEDVIRAFSVATPFFTLMTVALYATQGFKTVKYATYVQEVLRPLINLMLVVVSYLLGAQILGAIAAYVLSMAIAAATALYYLRRLFPKLLDRATPAKFEARKLVGASGPIMITKTTAYVNGWAMIWVMGAFASARDVGIFNAAFRTAVLSGLVLLAFSGIFAPIVSDLYKRGSLDQLGRLYKDVSRWIFTGSLAVFLLMVFLAKDVLALFGEEFVVGWPVVIVVSTAQLFSSSVGLTGRMLTMTGNEKRSMWARIIATAVTLAGGVALIPLYGLIGAAVAAATGLIAWNALTLFAVRRLLGFWPYNRQYFKPLAAGFLASGALLAAQWTLQPSEGIVAIAVLSPIFLALFTAFNMALRLSESDQQLLGAVRSAMRLRISGRHK